MSNKVAFPAPPPTTNSLTSQQRAQRLRTTKKLEQVLGSTPEWVDFAGTSLNDQPRPSKTTFKAVRPNRSASLSSLSAMMSQGPSMPGRRSPSPFLPSHSHPHVKKPILQICTSSPAPPSPSSLIQHASTSKLRSSTAPVISSPAFPQNFASASPSHTGGQPPVSEPPSPIAKDDELGSSDSSGRSLSRIRREKMQRLRRRLGHDVPVDLVFPCIVEEAEEDYKITLRPSGDDISRSFIQTPPPPPIPTAPIPSPSTISTRRPISPPPFIPLPVALQPQNRFASARDSLLIIDAPRREEPRKPSLDYSSATGDFLSLVDDDEDTEDEEDEVVVQLPGDEDVIVIGRDSFILPQPAEVKEKENRIAAWAQHVSRSSPVSAPSMVSPTSSSSSSAASPVPIVPQITLNAVLRQSAWFEDEDEASFRDAKTHPSSPADSHEFETGTTPAAESAQSLKTDMFLPYLSKRDTLELIEDDASAAFLLSYHGHGSQPDRWEWGVPWLDVRRRTNSNTISAVDSEAKGGLRRSMISMMTDDVVGLEALALSGMIF